MKKTLWIIICLIFTSGCIGSRLRNETIKAMERDYVSGKMSQETYFNRVEAIKKSPSWQPYYPKQAGHKSRLRRERFYREYRAFYTQPQQKEATTMRCFRNLDGGITCQKHVY